MAAEGNILAGLLVVDDVVDDNLEALLVGAVAGPVLEVLTVGGVEPKSRLPQLGQTLNVEASSAPHD